jgi:hypothetical protein
MYLSSIQIHVNLAAGQRSIHPSVLLSEKKAELLHGLVSETKVCGKRISWWESQEKVNRIFVHSR